MSSRLRLWLGQPVTCTDEPFGILSNVVVDPHALVLTHLIAEPHHRHDLARLVPADLLHATRGGEGVTLSCTTAQMRDLVEVQRTALVEPGQAPDIEAGAEIGIERMAVPPYYANPGLDGLGVGAPGTGYDSSVILSYDRIPQGSVELGRHSAVVSAAGDHLGHLTGILVGHDNEVVQLVLERGHLWGKREVAVPLAAVARMVTDEVTLSLTSADARKLGPPA